MTNDSPAIVLDKILTRLTADKLIADWAMARDDKWNPVSPFDANACYWNLLGALAFEDCFAYGEDGNIYVFGQVADIVRESARLCHGETLEWVCEHLPLNSSLGVLRFANQLANNEITV